MTDYFSHRPSPATPGGKVTVCFDFAAAGVTGPITATIDYSPSSVPDDSFTLTPDHPCSERDVPSKATTAIVSDASGHSEDHEIPLT